MFTKSQSWSKDSQRLFSSFLSNRTQLVIVKISYSNKSNIEYGVPQGSILGILLFNIDSIDFFFKCDAPEISSYVDDTTPCSWTDDIPSVIT